MPPVDPVRTETLNVRRFTISAPMGYDDLLARYEELVPELPLAETMALAQRGAPWDEMEQLVSRSSPTGFLRYGRTEFAPVFQNAGNPGRGVAFLMGNHILAERMYRHDARVMLHVPLRTLLWENEGADAAFSIAQPSTLLTGLDGRDEISTVGEQLDSKLADLLSALNLAVPEPLQA